MKINRYYTVENWNVCILECIEIKNIKNEEENDDC